MTAKYLFYTSNMFSEVKQGVRQVTRSFSYQKNIVLLCRILSQRRTPKTSDCIHHGSIYLTLEKISVQSGNFTGYCLCIKEYFDMFFSTPKHILSTSTK